MPSRILRIKSLVLRVAPVIALLTGAPAAVLAQSDVCVPAIGGLAPMPTIDGRVDGDPGWNGAVRLNLKELSGTPREGSMQLGRIGNSLYVSFEVEGTPAPGIDDLVVLGFSTTSNATQDWRVHISPFTAAGITDTVYQNYDPKERLYWRDSTNSRWNFNSTHPTTPGNADLPTQPFIGEVKVSRNVNNWAMEMRIPISTNIADAAGSTSIYLPPTSPTTFKFYVNVLSTFDLGGTFTQDPWPQARAMLVGGATGAGGTSGGNSAANRTPAPSTWGTASIFSRSVCTGVYLTWNSSNGVRQSPTGTIGYTSLTGSGPFTSGGMPINTVQQCEANLANNTPWPPGTMPSPLPSNYFVAKPGNDGPPASRVYVKFYVAPWGIPGAFDAGAPNAYWHPLGELYQPPGAPPVHSTLEETIPTDVGGMPALTAPLSTPPWQLSYKQACVYTKSNYYGNLGHHCLQAEAHSNSASVVIRNKSIQINHNFVEASVVERDAEISVKGRGAPAVKGKPHEMILFTQKVIQTFRRDGQSFQAVSIKGDATAAAPVGRAGTGTAPSGTAEPGTSGPGTVVIGDRPVVSPTLALASARVPAQFRALGSVPADRYPKGLDEGMTVITNGYLKKPDSMIIGSKSYQYAEYVGGYSYFAGHAGVALNWVESVALAGGAKAKTALGNTPAFQSLGVKPLVDNASKALPIGAHALQIPQDDTVTLAVRAEAQEPKPPVGTTPDDDKNCGRLRLGSAGGVLAAFMVTGFVWKRRRKPKQ